MSGEKHTVDVVEFPKQRFSLSRNLHKIRFIGRHKKIFLCIVIFVVLLIFYPLIKDFFFRPKPKQSISQLAASTSKNLSKGKTETAIKDLEAFVNSDTSKEEKLSAYLFLAFSYGARENDEKALVYLKNAEEIKNDIGYSGYTLAASIYEKKGDKKQAVQYYEKAIKSMKDSSEKSDDIYIEQYSDKIKGLSQ